MEIIASVLLLGLLLTILSKGMQGLSFFYKMLFPRFRKQYFYFRNILKDIKLSGDIKLLDNLIHFSHSNNEKYNFYYENNNQIENDPLYNSNFDNRRKDYVKIIETSNDLYLENNLKKCLKKNKNSDKPLSKYLLNEIKEISNDYINNNLNERHKIFKSKKRFITYLLETSIENKLYLENIIKDINSKIKN